MRSLTTRPIMLVLAVAAIVGSIAFIESRFSAAKPSDTQAQVSQPTTGERIQEPATGQTAKSAKDPKPTPNKTAKPEKPDKQQTQNVDKSVTESERLAAKEKKFDRAAEITGPTGYINTDGISLESLRGKKVVLLEFWTYTCYNCQNAQPYISGFHDKYAADGLQVIGVHSPEFEFEKDYNNVAAAVQKAGIQYPVVLDNNYATWNAYNNLYWPAWYLIDSDGFIRYKHFGEGAYGETEKKIQELLKEMNRT